MLWATLDLGLAGLYEVVGGLDGIFLMSWWNALRALPSASLWMDL